MTRLDIAHQRLHNQAIAQQHLQTPSELVGWMGAMQAQDYTGAKRSVGLRLPGAVDADIEGALTAKSIVRTWPMRGTLHFVTAADIRWILALMAPRMIATSVPRYAELELDEATLLRTNDLLLKALQGGKQLDRKSLLVMIEQNGISTAGQRAPYILQRASLDALICQGVTVNNNPTYVALDEALPSTKPLTRDEALAEMALRYFTSHGPATLQDFVWWTGLPVGEARAGLDAVQAHFIQEKHDGQTYWLHPATPAPQHHAPSMYLLPGFDEYLLGYRDRSAVLDPAHAKKVVPGGNGVFKPFIVADGRVVGLWKRTFKKDTVIVSAEPFDSLTPAQREAFAAAAQDYADFLGLSLVLAPD